MVETSRSRLRLRGKHRGLTLVAMLAVVLFLCVGTYLIGSAQRHDVSEVAGVDTDADLERLGGAVQAHFDDPLCPNAARASSAIWRTLRSLGFSDWSIRVPTGVGTDECVGAAIDADTRQVILIRGLSDAVRSALERVQQKSYADCLTERQVADMLTASLADWEVTDFSITTSGRLVAPTDQYEEVKHHVLSGCWVYSASTVSEGGSRTFFLTGPPPD